MSMLESFIWTLILLTLMTVGVPGFHISFMVRQENKKERNRIKWRKQSALEAIVHDDISADSDEEKKNMKKRILEYYDRDDVTPELIDYFKDNYISVLESETRKIAEQKALDEKKDQELNRTLQNLEKSKEAQLSAFKTVKELNQQSTGAQ